MGTKGHTQGWIEFTCGGTYISYITTNSTMLHDLGPAGQNEGKKTPQPANLIYGRGWGSKWWPTWSIIHVFDLLAPSSKPRQYPSSLAAAQANCSDNRRNHRRNLSGELTASTCRTWKYIHIAFPVKHSTWGDSQPFPYLPHHMGDIVSQAQKKAIRWKRVDIAMRGRK